MVGPQSEATGRLPEHIPEDISPEALDAHSVSLKQAAIDGIIVSAGRRDPAAGGLIPLRAETLNEAQPILNGDPFVKEGIAVQ
ncbi:YciI family protein [Haematobacter sp.]|uniref:YciI family protein n=1 Tax=Haematobacter sp. TaxID=2953762 RepID=UPI0028A941A6|nr:YciI family protein [Haematobacter sp.]